MKVCISCETEIGGQKAVPIKEDRIIKKIEITK